MFVSSLILKGISFALIVLVWQASMVMMRLLQLQGSPVIGPVCVLVIRYCMSNKFATTNTYTYTSRASGITLGQYVVWFSPLQSRYLYFMALHLNAPHFCHPHHVTDTRPANASHQKRGVDVIAKLAAQVTMSPCCHTIVWDEKETQVATPCDDGVKMLLTCLWSKHAATFT